MSRMTVAERSRRRLIRNEERRVAARARNLILANKPKFPMSANIIIAGPKGPIEMTWNYECAYCGESTPSREKLRSHQRTCSEKRRVFAIIRKALQTKSSFLVEVNPKAWSGALTTQVEKRGFDVEEVGREEAGYGGLLRIVPRTKS